MLKSLLIKVFCAALIILPVLNVAADVKFKDKHGFKIHHEVVVNKTTNMSWEAFNAIDQWWLASHTFSGEQKNLYLDTRKQRCFCEKLPDGGFVRHLAVVHVHPMKKLVFSGGLGPLQELAVSGAMIVRFAEQDGKTKITLDYEVYGSSDGILESWAKPVDGVLKQQLDSFEQYLTSVNKS